MYRSPVRHRVYWAAFLVSWVLLAVVIRHNVRQVDREIRREGISSAAVVASRSLLIDVLNVETGLRGYLVAGRREFLRPYHEGLGRMDADLAAMRTMIGRDRVEGPHAAEVARLAAGVAAEFANQVDAVERDGLGAGRDRFGRFPTKPAVDRVRDHLAAIRAEEDRRLADDLDRLNRSMATTLWMLDAFTTILVILLFAMLTGFVKPPSARVEPAGGGEA